MQLSDRAERGYVDLDIGSLVSIVYLFSGPFGKDQHALLMLIMIFHSICSSILKLIALQLYFM